MFEAEAFVPKWPTLCDLLEASYSRYADRVAVADNRMSLSYAELRSAALRVAAWLANQGIERGDRVVLLSNNRVEYVEVEHALTLGGYIRVAVAPRLHPVEVAGIIADSAASCVVAEAAWLAQAGTEFLADYTGTLVVIGGRDDAEVELRFPRSVTFEETIAGDVDSLVVPPTPSPDDAVWIIYTSGSTGTPKGVVHNHRSVTAMIAGTLWTMNSVDESDSAVHTAPLAHVSGTVGWAVTSLGGCNRLLAKFSPESVMDVVEQSEATILPMVPTQLNMVTDYLASTPRQIDSLRFIPYAGSAISPDRLDAATRLFGDALVQLYGSSECPMPMTVLFPRDHIAEVNNLGLPRFASAGKPPPGVNIVIRDSADVPLGVGEAGEITVNSPTACCGYWNNSTATAELFDSAGYIRTGDVGLVDEHGYLFIVDRKKDMIVSGGFNVYPREVENAISTAPGVNEVAVVGAPDDKWGEQIVAVLSLKPGVSYTLEEVREHCRRSLAGYKLPRRVVVVDDLPKGATGKILKKAVREQFWTGASRRVGG